MIQSAAFAVLALCAIYLVALGLMALFRPSTAWGFLSGHASTFGLNFIEAVLRGLAGTAFVIAGPSLKAPALAVGFGWFLLVTAILMVPFFPLHRRYARIVVPPLRRFLRPYGAVSVMLGVGLAVLLVDGWQHAA